MKSLPNDKKRPAGTRNRPAKRRRPPLLYRIRRGLKKYISSLPYLLPEGDTLLKGAVVGGLTVVFALLETTVFVRFKPFGATPDLLLPLIVAISMAEGEKWGAGTGLAAAFLVEALSSTGPTLLPILYGAVGILCPLVTTQYLTDSVPVRILYTAVSTLGRSIFTLLYLLYHVPDFHFGSLFTSVLLPEFAATLLLAGIPHLAVRLSLHPFHRSRAERTGSLS